MSKSKPESEFFSHDYDARHDEKLVRLRMRMGFEGKGLYWDLVEYLYQSGGRLHRDYETIAAALPPATPELVKRLLEDHSELFNASSKSKIGSKSVDRRLAIRLAKSEVARKKAIKRWKSSDATALPRQCQGNAITERTETTERKGKETTETTETARQPGSGDSPGIQNGNGTTAAEEARRLLGLVWKVKPKDPTKGPSYCGFLVQDLPADYCTWALNGGLTEIGEEYRAALRARLAQKQEDRPGKRGGGLRSVSELIRAKGLAGPGGGA